MLFCSRHSPTATPTSLCQHMYARVDLIAPSLMAHMYKCNPLCHCSQCECTLPPQAPTMLPLLMQKHTWGQQPCSPPCATIVSGWHIHKLREHTPCGCQHLTPEPTLLLVRNYAWRLVALTPHYAQALLPAFRYTQRGPVPLLQCLTRCQQHCLCKCMHRCWWPHTRPHHTATVTPANTHTEVSTPEVASTLLQPTRVHPATVSLLLAHMN